MDVHGSYRTVHAKDVRDTHNLIHINGLPHYYRERSPLWDWDDSSSSGAVFEPQYPCGLHVRPVGHDTISRLGHDHVLKLQRLARIFEGPIEIFGFEDAHEVYNESREDRWEFKVNS